MSSTRTSKTAGETRTDDGVPSGTVEPVIAVNGVEPDTSDPKVAEGTAEGDVPKMADLQGVRYTGFADVKLLTAQDLQSMGVDSPKGGLRWDASNGFTVGADQINAATRDVLAATKDFTVL